MGWPKLLWNSHKSPNFRSHNVSSFNSLRICNSTELITWRVLKREVFVWRRLFLLKHFVLWKLKIDRRRSTLGSLGFWRDYTDAINNNAFDLRELPVWCLDFVNTQCLHFYLRFFNRRVVKARWFFKLEQW